MCFTETLKASASEGHGFPYIHKVLALYELRVEVGKHAIWHKIPVPYTQTTWSFDGIK
jgi:hypothetical protein